MQKSQGQDCSDTGTAFAPSHTCGQVLLQVAGLEAALGQLQAEHVVLSDGLCGEAAYRLHSGCTHQEVGACAHKHAPGCQPWDHDLPKVPVCVVEDV